MSDSELSTFLQDDLKLHLRKRRTEEICRELVAKLPGRNITSITRHLLNRFVGKPTETWTKTDDATLRRLVAEVGKQWKEIGDRMGRSHELVRLRYRDYVSLGDARTGGKWEEREEKKLYKTVLKTLKTTEWEVTAGLSLDVVSRYVNWSIVSEKLGNRSPSQCREKWTRLEKWQPLDKKSGEEEGDDKREVDGKMVRPGHEHAVEDVEELTDSDI